ncbi:Glycosyltransferase [Melia azedarach]|uniref:Glycosyltransferase n=1 Tax=Melia azedarach TaxID=155640 RepID=A0ACC1YI29_MELAZ|nr:Glycosyltransferase [Melia azedarach]
MVKPHILLVTYPGQGHINPTLQFAKRLINNGVSVTYATSKFAVRRMNTTSVPDGLSFAAFTDDYLHGFKPGDDIQHYMAELKRLGSETLSELILTSANEGKRFTCVVYSVLLPWVGKVAAAAEIPSVLIWTQPATIFDIYYYYFNGYGDFIRNNVDDPSFLVKFPGLPELASRDLPSFFIPSNQYEFALPSLEEQMEILDEQTKPKVLVNTFDALEPEALKAIDKYNLVGIGPLIPSAFLDGKDPSDTYFGGDLFNSLKDYFEWLNSKPKSSVIYVSFGSISDLSKPQMEEIARGLLDSGRPFLWVIRENQDEEKQKEEDKLSCKEELKRQGKIVPWCSQVEVLSHPSVGCFVTHCGWNSTLESLTSGVPLVAFPQWTDQWTNAKLVADVWKTGVRVSNFNKEGIVEADEIKRCLELLMGNEERGIEMKSNAKKWKELARDAAKEGGSSNKNIKKFADEIAKHCQ